MAGGRRPDAAGTASGGAGGADGGYREYLILGDFDTRDRWGSIPLTAHKPRAMLAMLLLHKGRLVGWQRLTEELWAGTPPESAVANLRTYATGLRRRALGRSRLRADPGGYYLHLDGALVDLDEFDALCGRARQRQRRGDLLRARGAYERALLLWRGTPLSGLRHGPTLAASAAALEERRTGVLESLVDLRLDLGEADPGSPPELAELLRRHIHDHPLRERPRRQLAVALYRMGDVAGALDVCTDTRRCWREALGLDPDDRVDHLQAAVLARDPDLLRPGAQNRLGTRRSVTTGPRLPRPKDEDPVLPASRPLQVAVCGPRECTASERRMADEVGRLLARRHAVVLSSQGPGVPSAAASGARGEGGTVIGVGGGCPPAGHPVSAVIATGAGETELPTLVRSADVVMTIGGSWATLSAVTAAVHRRGVRVVMLSGWRIVDAVGRPVPGILVAADARQAVDLALSPLPVAEAARDSSPDPPTIVAAVT
jgi:uncharacterized protein (TIGR00725 family)